MQAIDEYLEIVNKFPLFFRSNESMSIVLDRTILINYAIVNDKKLGVIYKNDYYFFVADLIKSRDGRLYCYSRIIPQNAIIGVVMIPFIEERMGVLKQFRHGTRELELEFPRGFCEIDLTPEENAKRELYEEIGARPKSVNYEGRLISDSGLTGGLVDIFSIGIDKFRNFAADEGIESVIWLTTKEIKELINNNTIRDSFTISAFSKYLFNREDENVQRSH